MMNADQYRSQQLAGSSLSQARILQLFGLSALAGGLVSIDEFRGLAASVVSAANLRAAMLADLFTSKRLRTSPLGIGRPLDEAVRLAEAMQTIIADTDTPLPRLSRLAAAEPLSAAQSASREVLIRNEVPFYIWDTDSDPCSRCAKLADRIYPVQIPAIQHPGCTCLVLPLEESE